jgi:hypothetical protein
VVRERATCPLLTLRRIGFVRWASFLIVELVAQRVLEAAPALTISAGDKHRATVNYAGKIILASYSVGASNPSRLRTVAAIFDKPGLPSLRSW